MTKFDCEIPHIIQDGTHQKRGWDKQLAIETTISFPLGQPRHQCPHGLQKCNPQQWEITNCVMLSGAKHLRVLEVVNRRTDRETLRFTQGDIPYNTIRCKLRWSNRNGDLATLRADKTTTQSTPSRVTKM